MGEDSWLSVACLVGIQLEGEDGLGHHGVRLVAVVGRVGSVEAIEDWLDQTLVTGKWQRLYPLTMLTVLLITTNTYVPPSKQIIFNGLCSMGRNDEMRRSSGTG